MELLGGKLFNINYQSFLPSVAIGTKIVPLLLAFYDDTATLYQLGAIACTPGHTTIITEVS